MEGKQNSQYSEKQPFELKRGVLSRLSEMRNYENAVLKALEPFLPQGQFFSNLSQWIFALISRLSLFFVVLS